jgi:hypothetical protein
MKKLLAVAFIAAMAYGQDGVFHFTSPQTKQGLQEAATIVRTVADVPQLSIDETQSTLTMHAAPAQLAIAQWILSQLDTPGNESAVLEYKSPAADDVVRVNFLANVTEPRPMQELLTVLRTVADIAKVFNYNSRHALVLRAKSADMAFAEWIIDQLNLPANQKLDASPRVYPGVTAFNQVARVNYLDNISSQQGMMEMLTVLRMVGEIAKVFNYTSLHAMVLRAPDSDVARAEWMIQELHQPAGQQNAGAQVYQTPGADDVTRVFFLSNATPQGLNAAISAIQSETKNRKVFYMNAPAAVVVRGTADQIEAAVQVMAQRNGLAMLVPDHRPAE